MGGVTKKGGRYGEKSAAAKAAAKLYATKRWKDARVAFFMENPTCAYCQRRGEYGAAEVLDHIKPHKGDPVLFWDSANNWQSLCIDCHNGVKRKEERSGRKEMLFDAMGFPIPDGSNT